MVKVVDVQNDEVIKEIPPEEVLDTVARIREMIGLLVDKRA
jgi:flagellar protein FlaG